MNDKWFEEGINEKLGKYGSPIDLETAWAAFEVQRKPEKNKRYFGFWLSGCIMLSTLGGGLLYLNVNTDREHGLLPNIATIKEQPSDIILNKLSVERNVIETVTTVINEPSEHKSSSETLREIDFNNSKEQVPNSIENKNIQNNSQRIISTKKSESVKANSIATTVETSDKIILNKPKQEYRTLNANGFKPVIQQLSPLLRNSRLLPINQIELSEAPELSKEFNNSPRRVQDQRSNLIGITTGYGPRVSGRILAREIPLDVMSLNIYYQTFLSKNLYLKTGVNLDQFTNKVEGSLVKTFTEMAEDQIVAIYHYQDGTQIPVLDDAEIDLAETTTYDIFNRYQFLSIPVVIGVRLEMKKKSSFQIEAGMSSTIQSKYDMKYFDMSSTEKFIKFDDLNLRRSALLKGQYGIQWNYSPLRFSNNLEFLLKYQGSIQLNSLSIDPNEVLQPFNSHQVFFGLQYRI